MPAFTARCLLKAARAATLATQSDGQPFASLVTPAVAPDSTVLLLLSSLSVHTRHLRAEPRCALLATGLAAGSNPQTTPRVTISGTAAPESDPAWRAFWLARHPYAAGYAAFTDFSVWRLTPQSGHLVAGFAQAHTIARADLAPPRAASEALAEAASAIVAQCRAGHREVLDFLAHRAGRRGRWRAFDVDPDGIDLAQDGVAPDGLASERTMPEDAVLRIAFDRPVNDANGVWAALLRLAEAARVG